MEMLEYLKKRGFEGKIQKQYRTPSSVSQDTRVDLPLDLVESGPCYR